MVQRCLTEEESRLLIFGQLEDVDTGWVDHLAQCLVCLDRIQKYVDQKIEQERSEFHQKVGDDV